MRQFEQTLRSPVGWAGGALVGSLVAGGGSWAGGVLPWWGAVAVGVLGSAGAYWLGRGASASAAASAVLTGQVAVVTGSNTGVGLETAKTLAGRGATVIMMCRSAQRSEAAVDAVNAAGSAGGLGGSAVLVLVDLGDLDSVMASIGAVKEALDMGRIDILVCNAGIMMLPSFETTVQGVEKQWGTNHLGHAVLVFALLDSMAQAGRIVILASSAHAFSDSPLPIESADDYGPIVAYGTSKLANVLFARALQLMLKKAGSAITVYSVHPGVVNTELLRHVGVLALLSAPIRAIIAQDPLGGAQTSLYAALDEHAHPGGYHANCRVFHTTDAGASIGLAVELWDKTLDMARELAPGFNDAVNVSIVMGGLLSSLVG